VNFNIEYVPIMTCKISDMTHSPACQKPWKQTAGCLFWVVAGYRSDTSCLFDKEKIKRDVRRVIKQV